MVNIGLLPSGLPTALTVSRPVARAYATWTAVGAVVAFTSTAAIAVAAHVSGPTATVAATRVYVPGARSVSSCDEVTVLSYPAGPVILTVPLTPPGRPLTVSESAPVAMAYVTDAVVGVVVAATSTVMTGTRAS